MTDWDGQIFRIQWQNFNPTIEIREDDGIKSWPLFEQKISWKIGKKYCVGYWKNGYRPCPNNAEISYGSKCKVCKQLDEYFSCVKCDGSKCLNKGKRKMCMNDEFYIYLASFDSLLKVGISRTYRLRLRLIEQGADFGAKIVRIKDGKIARQTEQKIAKTLNIIDRVNGQQKFNNLFADPNLSLKNLSDGIERLKKIGMLKNDAEIFDLRKFYHLEKISAIPKFITKLENKTLNGKIVSLKGNLMIVETDDDFIAVNTHELLGRKIKFI